MNFPAIVERLTRLDFPGPTYIALTEVQMLELRDVVNRRVDVRKYVQGLRDDNLHITKMAGYDIVLKDSPEDLRRQREGWTAIFYP
jgi:hypothetical protein